MVDLGEGRLRQIFTGLRAHLPGSRRARRSQGHGRGQPEAAADEVRPLRGDDLRRPAAAWSRSTRAGAAPEPGTKDLVSPPTAPARLRAPGSRPARPATSTSAASGPRCSTGCSRAATAASSSCASTTPISSATSRRRWRRSSTASTGSASTGTKAPRSAARTRRTSSPSAAPVSGRRRRAARRGHAYHDYATPEEMEAERKAAQSEKRRFQYSRTLDGDHARSDARASRPKVGSASCA